MTRTLMPNDPIDTADQISRPLRSLLERGTEILYRCPLLFNQVHDCERGGIKFCHDPTSGQREGRPAGRRVPG